VIELFTSDTPNGKKIAILLEEIDCDFKVTAIDLSKEDQFKPDFKKISPFSKIPVIVDHENKESVCYKPMVNGADGDNWTNAWATPSVSSL
jgi:GST-like protein